MNPLVRAMTFGIALGLTFLVGAALMFERPGATREPSLNAETSASGDWPDQRELGFNGGESPSLAKAPVPRLHIDSGVAPAMFQPGGDASPATPSDYRLLKIIEVPTPGAGVEWPVSEGEPTVRFFTRSAAKLELQLPTDPTLKIKYGSDAGALTDATAVTEGKFLLLDKTKLEKNGSVHLFAGDNEKPFAKFTILLPVDGGVAPALPSVQTYAPATQSPLKSTPTTGELSLYDKSPILKLSGDGLEDRGRLLFFLKRPADKHFDLVEPQSISPIGDSSGRWIASLRLPITSVPSNGYSLLLMQIKEGKHSVSAKTLTINVAAHGDTLAKPAIDKVGGQAAGTGETPRTFRVNSPNPTFELTTLAGIADSVVHVFERGQSTPAGSRYVEGGSATQISLSQPLAEGRHDFELRHQQADGYFVASDPFVVVVRARGPRVVKVEPEKFGTAPGVTALRVFFSPENPLQLSGSPDPQLVSHFQVLGSGGSGTFDRGSELDLTSASSKPEATYDAASNSVRLTLSGVVPDIYQLTVRGTLKDRFGNALEGREGQPGSNYVQVLGRAPTESDPSDARGIVHTTGQYVPYQEFTRPRAQVDGFNPSDKVETRVARLYYFRDAHRVAQIINRKVKSYNRQGVDTARQLADRARNVAEQKTAIRQQAERNAIEKARKTRQKEDELRKAENAQQRTLEELTKARLQGTGLAADASEEDRKQAEANLDTMVKQFEAAATRFAARVESLQEETQKLRDEENEANELTQRAEAEERQSRDEQFRREVAAARSDPDTYAEGKPESDDPVEQVSVSVIGEGLIQLRGPIKGINIIRTMIDQIDAPVGQVRVAVHTVQLNGERVDRMEEVAASSQRYIDQARFLTLQSGELLRRAIVQVASQRADEARGLRSGETQEDRDERYLYAFFGRDFVDELKAMDSEFLRTGNKLLSLHSMDTTSLSSALTLMSLARNDTRMEILSQFEEFCQAELAQKEQGFIEQGLNCGLKKKHFGGLCKPPATVLLAGNARFESLRGFFSADVSHQDTMTPLQREFLRLAQILKSRLVVEMELKQRVTERAIIEERLGNRIAELQEAAKREKEAEVDLARVRKTRQEQQLKCIQAIQKLRNQLLAIEQSALEAQEEADGSFSRQILDEMQVTIEAEIDKEMRRTEGLRRGDPSQKLAELRATWRTEVEQFRRGELDKNGERIDPIQSYWKYRVGAFDALELPTKKREKSGKIRFRGSLYDYTIRGDVESPELEIKRDGVASTNLLRAALDDGLAQATEQRKYSNWFSNNRPKERRAAQAMEEAWWRFEQSQKTAMASRDPRIMIRALFDLQDVLDEQAAYLSLASEALEGHLQDLSRVSRQLVSPDANIERVSEQWSEAAGRLIDYLAATSPQFPTVKARLSEVDGAFSEMTVEESRYQQSHQVAQESRRPLDHKKFLDMLIDETEDKFIELLEGTRAHTANIDNYIKRLTTALDDDFNTQFYNPAFRLVRESSGAKYYNVQFGQIETTSVLANNRSFAKVSPAASMEFDLPQRDILLTEAISGAKALMNDVGALANDPTFLAMAKLNAGQSTATAPAGATNGFSVVRNVVPGLGGDTTEQVLAQNANGGPRFGSNLENLIPDPAIYKFETGTGYEIRPVIQPDGQAVVFGFQYLYSTQIREPVRADEKHLGRIKRHHIDTDVQLSNFELREVSRYVVALKASRTSRGVPGLEDIPLAGVLFRPAPSDESSLQQNVVLAQATIFPTLFDLMGLRWAPVVADLDPLRLQTDEFAVRGRNRMLRNRVYDVSSEKVDDFLRVPPGYRRPDLYRTQETVPYQHPNGYEGPGLHQQDSSLEEGYAPQRSYRDQRFAPPSSREGSPLIQPKSGRNPAGRGEPALDEMLPRESDPQPILEPDAEERGARYRPRSTAPRQSRSASDSAVRPASFEEPIESAPRPRSRTSSPASSDGGSRSRSAPANAKAYRVSDPLPTSR